MLSFFLQALWFVVPFSFVPTPLKIYLLTQSISKGWKDLWVYTFSPIIAEIPMILFSIFFLRRLPLVFLEILRIFGGLFILYLAWRTSQMQIDLSKEEQSTNKFRGFLNAVIIIWLNPQFHINWTTIVGPTFVAGLEQSILSGVAYMVGFYIVYIPSLFAWMLFPSMITNLLGKRGRVVYYLLALILAGYGIYMTTKGLSYFLS